MKIISCTPEQRFQNSSNTIDLGSDHKVPFYLRLPISGARCPVTGLSRSYLNSLILPNAENGHKPPVKSVSLRKRGAIRGVRLIVTDSLLAYLRGAEVAGANQVELTRNEEVQHG